MKRKMTMQEKLSRMFCDKRSLNKKALKIKRSLDEIQRFFEKAD